MGEYGQGLATGGSGLAVISAEPGAGQAVDHAVDQAVDQAVDHGAERWIEVAPGVHSRSSTSGLGESQGRWGGPASVSAAQGPRERPRAVGSPRHSRRVRVLLAVGALVAVIGGIGVGAGLLGATADPGSGGPRSAGAAVASEPSGKPTPTSREATSPPPAGDTAASGRVGGAIATLPAIEAVDAVEAVDWWGVLAVLDERRADALQRVDPEALSAYAVPGSPAWESDADLVLRLGEVGLRPEGLSSRLVAIEQARGCGGAACVVVVDRRSAYSLVDAQGESVEQVPAAEAQRWQVTLVPVAARDASDPGWRLREVVPIR